MTETRTRTAAAPSDSAVPEAAHRPRRRSSPSAVARAHGVETMFTLSGAHVFPMYDGAVTADPPMRLLDVRHEQTAAFAAEATGKLTRVPGLAVLTAGPGVTNGVSAIAQAQFAGSPDGRGRRPGPAEPLGQRQPPGARPAADPRAGHQARPHAAHRRATCSAAWTRRSPPPAPRTAGRSSSTSRWTSSSAPPRARRPAAGAARAHRARPDAIAEIAALLAEAPPARCWSSAPTCGPTAPRRPRCASSRRLGVPTITNGMGRGVVPGGHPLLVTKARSRGARRRRPRGRGRHAAGLPARLRRLRRQGRRATPAAVVHVADSPGQVSGHAELAASVSGDLTAVLDGLHAGGRPGRRAVPTGRPGSTELQDTVARRHRARRRRCSAPRPTRSTRRASTASWCRGWPTTPS